ncbi:MAG: molybdate ABC transporter substrate-binding protein [Anaerolineales bacterium]|nr:molybdate ABC transporter substrate-binding protein [Anaerolineales bacterium]
MKRIVTWIFLLAILLAGCSPASPAPQSASVTPAPRTLTVFAAASLTDAFTELGKKFEAQTPNVSVTFNFAGSQALRTQIEEGAPVDVFASANHKEMQALIAGAFVAQDSPQVFLNNKLVVILPADNPAKIDALTGLATPGVKIILAAEEVPVGKYSREAFEKMNAQFGSDFSQKLLANVVSNEDNVKQVVAKIQLDEADAGLVYTSDAVAAPELQTLEIPAELNVIAKYPIAPLVESKNADLAKAFIAYVLSNDGQAILEKWGFASP